MFGIRKLFRGISSGEVGFVADEVMTGWHEFETSHGEPGRRPMEFRVNWGSGRFFEWANPSSDGFMLNELRGTVTIEGLCRDAPCQGSLALRYFSSASIRYAFEFSVDGVDYRFVGEKNGMRPWNLAWTHTTCYGRLTLVESGELVSTSMTYFRFRTAPAFLRSFRLVA